MKKSNTIAENVVISQLQRDILLSIKELCMCIFEVVIIVDVVSSFELQSDIFLSIKKLFI